MNQLLAILTLLLLYSCSNDNKITEREQLQTAQLESNKEQFSKQNAAINTRLKGKRLDFLDSAVLAGSNPKMENSLIFLARKTDCSTCTSKALEVLNSFESTNLNRISVTIGYSDVGGYTNDFRYSFNDPNGVIQDKLGYFHTPALILYGQKGIISSYLIPTYEDSIGLSNYVQTLYEIL